MTDNTAHAEPELPELVTVLETNSITEALLAKSLLEAEGIEVDYVSYGMAELTATMMGAKLMVSSEQASQARDVLAARRPLAEDADVGPSIGPNVGDDA